MQWWEINRFMSGLQRRYHAQYDAIRHLQWYITCAFHNEKSAQPAPQHPQDLYKFTWEKEIDHAAEAPTLTEKDAKELQELITGFKW
jgi:hypothetical protein